MAQLRRSSRSEPTGLLHLPKACLLAIMQHCKEPAGLLTAARAHSSLRTAAAAALPAVSLDIKHQRQLQSLSRFLAAHSQHVRHLDLRGGDDKRSLFWSTCWFVFGGAPLQLHSLALRNLRLSIQMMSAGMHTGAVLAGQSCLTRLVLDRCALPAGSVSQTVTAVLQQLPSLQHLKVVAPVDAHGCFITLPGEVLAHLQSLTYLELNQGAIDRSNVLQHISALTALQDLRIISDGQDAVDPGEYQELNVTPDTLGALSCLTSLRLNCCDEGVQLDPRALAGKPFMQHLQLARVRTFVDGQLGLGTAGLLSELQHMEQLTFLDLACALDGLEPGAPPASAYTALKASSRLQYLNLSRNFFPEGTWQQLFGPSRQLPELRGLDISWANIARDPDPELTAADTPCLVRCCPGLQELFAHGTLREAGPTAVLSSLSSFTRLSISGGGDRWASFHDSRGARGVTVRWYEGLAALTGLRDLDVLVALEREQMAGSLMKLTKLQHLTRLHVYDSNCKLDTWECKEPGQAPVWRQVQHYSGWVTWFELAKIIQNALSYD